jgi:hypothetical protein
MEKNEEELAGAALSAVSASALAVSPGAASASVSSPFRLLVSVSKEASSDSQRERKLSAAVAEEVEDKAGNAPFHPAPCVSLARFARSAPRPVSPCPSDPVAMVAATVIGQVEADALPTRAGSG